LYATFAFFGTRFLFPYFFENDSFFCANQILSTILNPLFPKQNKFGKPDNQAAKISAFIGLNQGWFLEGVVNMTKAAKVD